MELSFIQEEYYTDTPYVGALSTGLTDLCGEWEDYHNTMLADEVDFAIVIDTI